MCLSSEAGTDTQPGKGDVPSQGSQVPPPVAKLQVIQSLTLHVSHRGLFEFGR